MQRHHIDCFRGLRAHFEGGKILPSPEAGNPSGSYVHTAGIPGYEKRWDFCSHCRPTSPQQGPQSINSECSQATSFHSNWLVAAEMETRFRGHGHLCRAHCAERIACQLPRVSGTQAIPPVFVGLACAGQNRQYLSGGVHQQMGRDCLSPA